MFFYSLALYVIPPARMVNKNANVNVSVVLMMCNNTYSSPLMPESGGHATLHDGGEVVGSGDDPSLFSKINDSDLVRFNIDCDTIVAIVPLSKFYKFYKMFQLDAKLPGGQSSILPRCMITRIHIPGEQVWKRLGFNLSH